MTEREKIIELTKAAKPGTPAHSLRAQAENPLTQFDYCSKCTALVHASLACGCGAQATTVLPSNKETTRERFSDWNRQRPSFPF
jgi:hypothetical protein